MRSIFFVAASLVLSTAVIAQGSKQETIEGNGNMITRNVVVSPFTEIKASGVYELKLSQGNNESVKIEADENLQDLFIVKNEGNKLVIDMKKLENKNLKIKNKLRVHVTFKSLKDLELSMVGNVLSDGPLSFDNLDLSNQSVGNVNLNLTANKLNLENKSVGNITLTGKAENAVMLNESVGSLRAGDFVVQTMNIDNSGIGSAHVNAQKELKVKDTGMGRVKNKGTATTRNLNKVKI